MRAAVVYMLFVRLKVFQGVGYYFFSSVKNLSSHHIVIIHPGQSTLHVILKIQST